MMLCFVTCEKNNQKKNCMLYNLMSRLRQQWRQRTLVVGGAFIFGRVVL